MFKDLFKRLLFYKKNILLKKEIFKSLKNHNTLLLEDSDIYEIDIILKNTRTKEKYAIYIKDYPNINNFPLLLYNDLLKLRNIDEHIKVILVSSSNIDKYLKNSLDKIKVETFENISTSDIDNILQKIS